VGRRGYARVEYLWIHPRHMGECLVVVGVAVMVTMLAWLRAPHWFPANSRYGFGTAPTLYGKASKVNGHTQACWSSWGRRGISTATFQSPAEKRPGFFPYSMPDTFRKMASLVFNEMINRLFPSTPGHHNLVPDLPYFRRARSIATIVISYVSTSRWNTG
jgi:hypothetical protein